MDKRIGSKFLKSSVGFGGSCFKKDILNLVYLCKYFEIDEVAKYWENVIKINDFQKRRFSNKIINALKKIKNKPTITLWGWAFKKNTNDSRESASIEVAINLLKNNINLNVYDPMVTKETIFNDLKDLPKSVLKNLKVCSRIDNSLAGSYGIAIMTEWDEFIDIDYSKKIDKLIEPIVFIDGRNIIDLELIQGKFKNIMSLDS